MFWAGRFYYKSVYTGTCRTSQPYYI
uniref:Uncharacterized protein n=1 Tax=Arundo donax TaxID=35708 RepID=A0A0A9BG10_ARUDO